MGLLDGIADIFLCFWGNFTLFATVAGPICIPTSGVYVFPFLHILASHLLSLVFLTMAIQTGVRLMILSILSAACWPFSCALLFFFSAQKADPALTIFTLPVNEIIQMLTHTLCVCRVGFFMVSWGEGSGNQEHCFSAQALLLHAGDLLGRWAFVRTMTKDSRAACHPVLSATLHTQAWIYKVPSPSHPFNTP